MARTPFAELVREERTRRGFSQRELANKLTTAGQRLGYPYEVTEATVGRWERGETEPGDTLHGNISVRALSEWSEVDRDTIESKLTNN